MPQVLLRSIAFGAFSLLSLVACATMASGQSSEKRGRSLSMVPISAEINGEAYRLVLDTGSAVHGFADSLLEKVGASLGFATVITPSGETSERVFLVSSLEIGGLKSADSYAVSVDVPKIAHALDVDIQGILGAQVLQMAPVLIRAGVEATFKSDLDGFEATGELHLALDQFGRVHSNNIHFGDSQQFTLIDTGFLGCVTLSEPLFDGLVSVGEIRKVGIQNILTVNGEASKESGVLASMRFGDLVLKDVPVLRSSSNTIGLRFLRNMDVVIDIKNQRLLFVKEHDDWDL